jgi:hypothetical protein
MLGMRLRPWVLLAGCALPACAGGSEGPTTTSAFDPTPDGSETGPATTSGTGTGTDDAGMTTLPPADATGDPPSDGSCCMVAPTPGCGNQETEMCVCTIMPACCQGVWNQDCVDLAIDPCGDPACAMPGSTGEPGDSSSSGGGPPTLACDELAMQEGWMYWRCQAGDLQCNDMGTPTSDCDYCCGYCNEPGDVSCGGLSDMNGWGAANCEWNGNGACNGVGTPTCDCNFCCEVN